MSEISPDPAAATPPDVAARDPQDARDTQDTQDSHSTPGGSTPQRSKVVPATVALTAAAAAIALSVASTSCSFASCKSKCFFSCLASSCATSADWRFRAGDAGDTLAGDS